MTLCILLKYTKWWGKGQVMLLKKRFAGCRSRKHVFGIQEVEVQSDQRVYFQLKKVRGSGTNS